MPSLVSLLTERFSERKEKVQKMNELVERSHQGKLSSFSGVFQVSDITEDDRKELSEILASHAHEKQETNEDFQFLLAITSEIKAINNQAIMLHGERIRRAQGILRKYKEGAFSKWLVAAYGNRQTPYNFLQFYEFYMDLDDSLRKVVDEIPKQVIYSLSSRKGSVKKKEEFIKEYKGENKHILLQRLRNSFPLKKEDKRNGNHAMKALLSLKRVKATFSQKGFLPTLAEKKALRSLLEELQAKIND